MSIVLAILREVLDLPLLVGVTIEALPDLDLVALCELSALVVEAEDWRQHTLGCQTHSSQWCPSCR